MDIQVDTNQLFQKSNDIKALKSELKKITEDIELLVLSSKGSWQGEAERAFSEKIIYIKNRFSDIEKFFDDYSETLKKIAYSYERQENDLRKKISLA